MRYDGAASEQGEEEVPPVRTESGADRERMNDAAWDATETEPTAQQATDTPSSLSLNRPSTSPWDWEEGSILSISDTAIESTEHVSLQADAERSTSADAHRDRNTDEQEPLHEVAALVPDEVDDNDEPASSELSPRPTEHGKEAPGLDLPAERSNSERGLPNQPGEGDGDRRIEQARAAVDDAISEGERSAGPPVKVLEISGLDQVEGDHVDTVLRIQTPEGTREFFKPVEGQAHGIRDAVPENSGWKREIAASQLNEILELDVVPTTVGMRLESTDEPLTGSLQAEVPHEARTLDSYAANDIDRMAVLDYVIATSDRHTENYRTSENGRPLAIDNSFSFPESSADPIRSDFVVQRLGQPLDTGVLEDIRSADDVHIDRVLAACGISPEARNGVLSRLHEVQEAGAITGDAWEGKIVTADLRTERHRRR